MLKRGQVARTDTMPTPPPQIRIIVRLPYNRPEDPLPDPPRVGAMDPYDVGICNS